MGWSKNTKTSGEYTGSTPVFYTTPITPHNFSHFLTMCGLAKLGLVDQNWLERIFSVFLPRTLVVGRRQHSESIEVALDME